MFLVKWSGIRTSGGAKKMTELYFEEYELVLQAEYLSEHEQTDGDDQCSN